MRKWQLNLLIIPSMLWVSSLLLLQDSLSLTFKSLVIMCLGVELVLLGVHWTSSILDSCLLSNLWSFQPLLLQMVFLTLPLSLLLLTLPPSIFYVSLMVFCKSLRLCSFFFILFSFCPSDWIISFILSLNSWIHLSVQVCCCTALVNFSFQLFYLSAS